MPGVFFIQLFRISAGIVGVHFHSPFFLDHIDMVLGGSADRPVTFMDFHRFDDQRLLRRVFRHVYRMRIRIGFAGGRNERAVKSAVRRFHRVRDNFNAWRQLDMRNVHPVLRVDAIHRGELPVAQDLRIRIDVLHFLFVGTKDLAVLVGFDAAFVVRKRNTNPSFDGSDFKVIPLEDRKANSIFLCLPHPAILGSAFDDNIFQKPDGIAIFIPDKISFIVCQRRPFRQFVL